jgi:hypothetical protein
MHDATLYASADLQVNENDIFSTAFTVMTPKLFVAQTLHKVTT